ncbi:GNAT family N-acetyltransferase [Brevibacillus sp. SYSU BS000544]|uniref:GNAT family N-acetyltransferase n=1 Tax=Brevibacillus sp. SYSU BS000544 TaxID=3416443 RepID=UPI003CE5B4AA
MINRLEIEQHETAVQVLNIQLPSYQIEAELIGFYDIPPLKDTVETLQSCGETFYGFFYDGELAGAISYKREQDILDIHRLIVHPDHFRKGIAQSLLSYIHQVEQGIDKVIVSTGQKNTPAKKLYTKNGFHPIQEIEVAPNFFLTCFEKEIK